MRITKSILMTALFALILGTASASTNPETNSARNEIKNLIEKADIADNIEVDIIVKVNFMVNSNNEIIIISTDQKNLDSSIKSALNYKKLNSSDIKVNMNYTLPVSLKKY